MPQLRKGKYTKKISSARNLKRVGKRRFDWFRRLSWPKRIAVILTPIIAALIIIPILTYAYFARDIADQERLMNRNNTGIVLLDKNGKVLYEVGKAEKRDVIPLSEISDDLEHAVVASEDKDFYEHGGFSILSIFRAAFTGYGGGSTITQQLAKNTLLSDKYSYIRKYQELFMSIAIEHQYSKDQILEMYLNSVYYGENTFGIEDAAARYFGKKPADLDLAESAMLIGLLPAPSAYSPISGDAEKAKSRQDIVLSRMVENGYITEEQKTAAQAEKLSYKKADESTDSLAPHFAEMVINELSDKYGYETVMRSGYKVETTLDLEAQKKLLSNIESNRERIAANGASNASGVIMNSKTGGILALVGSADYSNKEWGKINMATTPRQPASTFKTIYYAGALANGTITPATELEDKAININGWQPKNADRRFRGTVTVRQAISQSLNIPSIEVMQKYGVSAAVTQANALGVTSLTQEAGTKHGLSLAIGSAEVPLLEMTDAYATLSNQGMRNEPLLVQSITDKFDKNIFTAETKSEQGISQAGAFLISDILSDNDARAPMFGSSLNVTGHTVAVKTGTNDDELDAWTIGYTPSVTVGIWVGNADNSPMSGGGAAMAGPIWQGTMTDILGSGKDEKFSVPSSVTEKGTCYSNHGIATNSETYGTYKEYYLASALPSKTCSPYEPKPIKVCNLGSKKIEEIDEKNFDASKYSKNVDDCEATTEISVCNLSTGTVVKINESDFSSSKYSKDTANCAPPDTTNTDTTDATGTDTTTDTTTGGTTTTP